MAIINSDITQAVSLLKKGEVVAIPTETVYGLAANALDTKAVANIFEIKNRPSFDPLIVHIAALAEVEKYASDIHNDAIRLAEIFWPGPLTLLLPKNKIVPDLVTAGLDTVGLRCPDHPMALALLRQLDFPLAAPSANPFGYVSPTSAQHVQDQLGGNIPFVLDGGQCQVGVESTIVGFQHGEVIIHRLGGLSVEEIEAVVGKVKLNLNSSSNPSAPGQLSSHYAPTKKVIVGDLDNLIKKYYGERIGVLSFQTHYQAENSFVLSSGGSLTEAARNIFGMLRALDQCPVDFILCEYVPEVGLGRAINDRLRRAGSR
jgi:L-threonylcarbamoyladenylate synthase